MVIFSAHRYKGDVLLSTGGRYKIASSDGGKFSFTISSIESPDDGKYTVKASNDFGESRCTATLLVRGVCEILI
jgi:Immunoglobulin I-set domain